MLFKKTTLLFCILLIFSGSEALALEADGVSLYSTFGYSIEEYPYILCDKSDMELHFSSDFDKNDFNTSSVLLESGKQGNVLTGIYTSETARIMADLKNSDGSDFSFTDGTVIIETCIKGTFDNGSTTPFVFVNFNTAKPDRTGAVTHTRFDAGRSSATMNRVYSSGSVAYTKEFSKNDWVDIRWEINITDKKQSMFVNGESIAANINFYNNQVAEPVEGKTYLFIGSSLVDTDNKFEIAYLRAYKKNDPNQFLIYQDFEETQAISDLVNFSLNDNKFADNVFKIDLNVNKETKQIPYAGTYENGVYRIVPGSGALKDGTLYKIRFSGENLPDKQFSFEAKQQIALPGLTSLTDITDERGNSVMESNYLSIEGRSLSLRFDGDIDKSCLNDENITLEKVDVKNVLKLNTYVSSPSQMLDCAVPMNINVITVEMRVMVRKIVANGVLFFTIRSGSPATEAFRVSLARTGNDLMLRVGSNPVLTSKIVNFDEWLDIKAIISEGRYEVFLNGTALNNGGNDVVNAIDFSSLPLFRLQYYGSATNGDIPDEYYMDSIKLYADEEMIPFFSQNFSETYDLSESGFTAYPAVQFAAIMPAVIERSNISYDGVYNNNVYIVRPKSILDYGKHYLLNVGANIKNCTGNPIINPTALEFISGYNDGIYVKNSRFQNSSGAPITSLTSQNETITGCVELNNMTKTSQTVYLILDAIKDGFTENLTVQKITVAAGASMVTATVETSAAQKEKIVNMYLCDSLDNMNILFPGLRIRWAQ